MPGDSKENADHSLTRVSPSLTTILGMTEKARLKIAAVVTTAFLAATVSVTTLTHASALTASTARSAHAAAPSRPSPSATPHPTTENGRYD
jgi:hypothetical protein